MPRWVTGRLARIRELAAAEALCVTYKAQREALALGLSPEDVRDVVAGLGAGECAGRVIAEGTGEWMYVFKPKVGGQILYVKVVLRDDCVVVSFHDHECDDHGKDEG